MVIILVLVICLRLMVGVLSWLFQVFVYLVVFWDYFCGLTIVLVWLIMCCCLFVICLFIFKALFCCYCLVIYLVVLFVLVAVFTIGCLCYLCVTLLVALFGLLIVCMYVCWLLLHCLVFVIGCLRVWRFVLVTLDFVCLVGFVVLLCFGCLGLFGRFEFVWFYRITVLVLRLADCVGLDFV